MWLKVWTHTIGPRGLGLPTVMRDDTVSATAWESRGWGMEQWEEYWKWNCNCPLPYFLSFPCVLSCINSLGVNRWVGRWHQMPWIYYSTSVLFSLVWNCVPLLSTWVFTCCYVGERETLRISYLTAEKRLACAVHLLCLLHWLLLAKNECKGLNRPVPCRDRSVTALVVDVRMLGGQYNGFSLLFLDLGWYSLRDTYFPGLQILRF